MAKGGCDLRMSEKEPYYELANGGRPVPLRAWKTLDAKTLHSFPPYLTLESRRLQLPDGRVIEDWPWLIMPDFILVLARTVGGRFLVFRQTKYAVEGPTLAPIGGFLEQGEDPLEGARRELREETGHEAARWISLGDYIVDANRGGGRAHLFLALDASRVAAPVAGDLEDQQLLEFETDGLRRAIDAGEFRVMGWTCLIALALRRIESGTA